MPFYEPSTVIIIIMGLGAGERERVCVRVCVCARARLLGNKVHDGGPGARSDDPANPGRAGQPIAVARWLGFHCSSHT